MSIDNLLNPHKSKFHLYYMQLAIITAFQSVSNKRKVGAVVVTPAGMLATGWNGMPVGMDNACEDIHNKARIEVIHAEENAIDKMTNQGVVPKGSLLFTTTAPCIQCARLIARVGIKKVYFKHSFKNNEGLLYLQKMKISAIELT